MPAIDWHFDKVGSGQVHGWNHDGTIAEFSTNRLQNLTREIIQNSLDAKSEDAPLVKVSFVESRRSRDELPGASSLTEALSECREMGLRGEPRDIQREIEHALEHVQREKITVLSVSDTGTKGMPGPCEEGQPFHRYLKTQGESAGAETRAGSHGLGKAAPICTSGFRTIVAATTWEENGRHESLLQGRATLRTHRSRDENGDEATYGPVGFWGRGFDALRPEECPRPYRWMAHQGGVGTTIHILGWEPGYSRDWKDLIFGYAASNYFAALARGQLEVVVGDHPLNRETVERVLHNERIRAAMRRAARKAESLDNARFFYNCIATKEGVLEKRSQMGSLGSVVARMRVEDGAPRRFAVIRNGMLITTNLQTFWSNPPRRFRDFAGVFECESQDGNRLLRSMEPPKHDDLSPEMIDAQDTEKRRVAEASLRRVGEFLEKFVEEEASHKIPPGSKVDFMKEFLADDAGDEGVGDDEPDPEGDFKIVAQPPKPERPDNEAEQQEPGEGDGDSTTGGPGGNEGEGGSAPGTGGPGDEITDGGGATKRRRIETVESRVVKKGKTSVKVFVRASRSMDAHLCLHEVGADSNEPIALRNENGGAVSGRLVSLKAGEKTGLDLTLDREPVGGLKVIVFAVDAEEGSS